MAEMFRGSRLKVQRACKHINEVQTMLADFANSDFYTVSIQHDSERQINFVHFEIDKSGFPIDGAALAIGDALHNLHSAIDHLWYDVVLCCGGEITRWTNFPIFDTGEGLVNAINCALKKKQISITIAAVLLETIKPYQGANPALWGLHRLNIRDKHELFVPVLKLMRFTNVRLEDNEQRRVGRAVYIMDESSTVRLGDADHRTVTVKDKGKASATILFDIGTPFEGEAVVPALQGIAKEVSNTIEAFNILLT